MICLQRAMLSGLAWLGEQAEAAAAEEQVKGEKERGGPLIFFWSVVPGTPHLSV